MLNHLDIITGKLQRLEERENQIWNQLSLGNGNLDKVLLYYVNPKESLQICHQDFHPELVQCSVLDAMVRERPISRIGYRLV